MLFERGRERNNFHDEEIDTFLARLDLAFCIETFAMHFFIKRSFLYSHFVSVISYLLPSHDQPSQSACLPSLSKPKRDSNQIFYDVMSQSKSLRDIDAEKQD